MTHTSAVKKPRAKKAFALKSNAQPTPATLKAPSKSDIIVGLLNRTEGATLDQMVAATDWLPHTTRAMLTGLRKKGHKVESDKADGVRTYRITPEAVAGE